MSKEPFASASRGQRAIHLGALSLTLLLLLMFALSGCAPEAAPQLPPAAAVAVTAAAPATAVPATVVPPTAVPPTSAPLATAKATPQPAASTTQAAQPVGNADLLVTIVHTNDVGGETDPCG